MKDISKKIDAMKAAIKPGMPEPTDDDARMMAHIAIDFIGELVTNSRRIADALQKIAGGTPDSSITIDQIRKIARNEVDRGPTKLGGR